MVMKKILIIGGPHAGQWAEVQDTDEYFARIVAEPAEVLPETLTRPQPMPEGRKVVYGRQRLEVRQVV